MHHSKLVHFVFTGREVGRCGIDALQALQSRGFRSGWLYSRLWWTGLFPAFSQPRVLRRSSRFLAIVESVAFPSVSSSEFLDWERSNSLFTFSSSHSIVNLHDSLYSIGGFNGEPLNTVQIYNHRTDKWSAGPPLEAGRFSCGATVLDYPLE